mmetsp:Transcript_6336/g.18556  ORF Transcript_6336/g.18556 Transcript_6336/m.18556 type:complete len:787 (-) Transcript_6336:400-2760(-)
MLPLSLGSQGVVYRDEVLEPPHKLGALVLKEHHCAGRGEELEVVSHQEDRLGPEETKDAVVEDVAGHLRVHRAETVVQEVEIRVRVDGAGDGDPLLLAAGEVDALLADFRHVAGGEDLQVVKESAGVEDSTVLVLIEGFAEEHIVLEGGVLDPGDLGGVGDGAAGGDGALGGLDLADEGAEEPRLAAARLPNGHTELAVVDLEVEVLEQGGAVVPDQRCALGLDPWPRTTQRRGAGKKGAPILVLGPGSGLNARECADLGRDEERPDALEREPRLQGRSHGHGEQGQREAENVEEGQGSEGDGRRELVAEHDVHGKARDGDQCGHDCPEDPGPHLEHLVVEEGLELLVPDVVDLAAKGPLPGVELDDLHAAQDLVLYLDALVLDLHDHLLQGAALRRDLGRQRYAQHHDSDASKGRDSKQVVQVDDGHRNLEDAAPEHGNVAHGVLEPLGVDGHEIHNLARGLLAPVLLGALTAAAVFLVPRGRPRISVRGTGLDAERLVVDRRDRGRLQPHACAKGAVEVRVEDHTLRHRVHEEEAHEQVALGHGWLVIFILVPLVEEMNDCLHKSWADELLRVIDELEQGAEHVGWTKGSKEGHEEGRPGFGLLATPLRAEEIVQVDRVVGWVQAPEIILFEGLLRPKRDHGCHPQKVPEREGATSHFRTLPFAPVRTHRQDLPRSRHLVLGKQWRFQRGHGASIRHQRVLHRCVPFHNLSRLQPLIPRLGLGRRLEPGLGTEQDVRKAHRRQEGVQQVKDYRWRLGRRGQVRVDTICPQHQGVTERTELHHPK